MKTYRLNYENVARVLVFLLASSTFVWAVGTYARSDVLSFEGRCVMASASLGALFGLIYLATGNAGLRFFGGQIFKWFFIRQEK